MRRKEIYIIIFILLLIAGFLLYHYVFSIYETTISVTPQELFADNSSTLTIKSVPINALGMKAPYRDSPAEFEIREGKELVEIIEENEQEGFLIIRAKNKTGTVVVLIEPEYSLLPSSVEINIYPNLANNL